MKLIFVEWLLLRRSRSSVVALALLCVLSIAAVCVGLVEVDRQRTQQVRLLELQSEETEAQAQWIAKTADAGNAAYYSFHPTWNPPSSLAFAALGFRDVAPQTLRVRALGLEAQLYENESFNPEMALLGRFDFAFVVIYLAPLFIIALLHDLVSRERESGRLPLLVAMSSNVRVVWWTRILIRTGLVSLALLVPFAFAAWREGASPAVASLFSAAVLAYLAFWSVLVRGVGLIRVSSAAHAGALVATWATLTLALPSAAQAVIAGSVPVDQGMKLTLAHRQAVHVAWDIPKETTMQAFFRTHPEWRDTPPITGQFHWKWYLAFHQVGDESVAEQAKRYREGLLDRQRLTGRAGWTLPPVAAQLFLHRLAKTDLPAQLAYEDAIRAYHEELRRFYYPYLFNELPYGREDFVKAPEFRFVRP
jgi:ABC-2 type transport system permease protein